MRKIFICLTLLFSAIMILSVSCDDNATAVIQEDTKEFLVIAAVSMRPYMEIMGDIWSINGNEPDFDSILFADSTCPIYKSMAHIEGNYYHYGFSYSSKADSLQFESGDVTSFKMFRGNETASTDIVMLTMPEDSMQIISYPDSVNLNEDITVVWNKV